jgi:hypothetical protein
MLACVRNLLFVSSSDADLPIQTLLLNTALIPVRLERTRDVLRELLRSLTRALPIMAGVAGPVVIALLALAGVPPMKAVTLPWRGGLALWMTQAVAAAWPLWALRRRLLPESWCVQLRCLPLTARALWASDLAVSAALMAPLGVLYAISVVVFAMHRPTWWLRALPFALLSLVASWVASWLIGALALAWQRHGGFVRASGASDRVRPQAPQVLLETRLSSFAALWWWPAWRGWFTPGAPSLIFGVAVAIALAIVWTQGWWPVVPGAAWALMFSMLAIALTERWQRTVELHTAALQSWMASLPVSGAWRWHVRALVCAPMVAAGAAAVVLVLVSRPWRAPPLAAFAIGLIATPMAMTSVPSANREAHVAIWAVSAALLTALGSELWN